MNNRGEYNHATGNQQDSREFCDKCAYHWQRCVEQLENDNIRLEDEVDDLRARLATTEKLYEALLKTTAAKELAQERVSA